MEDLNLKEKIIRLEHDMWEAALRNDVASFKKLVSDDAVMICGGERCSGKEYAEFVRFFNISGYSISDDELIHMDSDSVHLHYIVNVEVNDPKASDLAGSFHVVSLWEKHGENWILTFNMDSRMMSGGH